MRNAAAPVCTACPLTTTFGDAPVCVLICTPPTTTGTAVPPTLMFDDPAAIRLPRVILGEAKVCAMAATTSYSEDGAAVSP